MCRTDPLSGAQWNAPRPAASSQGATCSMATEPLPCRHANGTFRAFADTEEKPRRLGDRRLKNDSRRLESVEKPRTQ
jgi:hypothetical protein